MNEDGKVVIKIDLNTKTFEAEITDTQDKLNKMVNEYNRLQEISKKGVQINTEQFNKLAVSIQKTSNKLITLKEAQEKLNEDTSDNEKKINLLENLTKGAKKLAFGILGIRTAYTIIRKASSSYLATDTQTTNQLEANWTAIGTFMETVIKAVSTLMKKLVTSILYFASVLTGVNYIEKANTAILKKQTKATQGLVNANNKLKASFDEIETIGDNSSGGFSSDIDTSVLFDVADIGENAKNTIEKVGKALKPVYEIIKNIIDYSLQHPNVILAALGGIALLKTLTSIIGVAGIGGAAGTGLAGIGSMLSYIAGFGVIAIEISILYNTVKEARDATKLASDETEKWKNGIIELNDTAKLILGENKDTPEFIENLSDRIGNHVQELINDTKEIEKNRKEMNLFEMIISAITGEWDNDTQKIIANYEAMKSDIEVWEEAYKQGKLNDEQIKEYNKTLKAYKKYLEDATYETSTHSSELRANEKAYKDAKEELKKTKERLNELNTKTDENKTKTKEMTKQVNEYNKALGNVKKDVTTKINVDTTGAKNGINNLFSRLKNTLLTSLGITFPTIRLARGGIVNNPGRGVSIGSNIIAGEAGPEAVLPLNEQTMGAIARLIADKMVINLTNVNQMNGRLINRELQKVQSESKFATNR